VAALSIGAQMKWPIALCILSVIAALLSPILIFVPDSVSNRALWAIIVVVPLCATAACIRSLLRSRGPSRAIILILLVFSALMSILGAVLAGVTLPVMRKEYQESIVERSYKWVDESMRVVLRAAIKSMDAGADTYPRSLEDLIKNHYLAVEDIVSVMPGKKARTADRESVSNVVPITFFGVGVKPRYGYDDKLLVAISEDIRSDHTRVFGYASGRTELVKRGNFLTVLEKCNRYRVQAGMPMIDVEANSSSTQK
jgi:hypothetical protein